MSKEIEKMVKDIVNKKSNDEIKESLKNILKKKVTSRLNEEKE